jgi:EAL domain-containing protein (putative c-di-GMP-specific phosphodiesterase class I)
MSSDLGKHVRRSQDRVILAPNHVAQSPLNEALERVVRLARPASVLMLRLSGLHAPGPRPHHRRIARALLDEVVRGHGGQVFTCPNGDLVLLSDPAPAASVMATLSQLFRLEAPSRDALLALWSLPADHDAARSELRRIPTTAPVAEDPPAPLGAIAAVGALLAAAPFGDLIRRQAGVRIGAGEVETLYQELSFSLPALEAKIGLPLPAGADPYLFRHLAARLDERMLEALVAGSLQGGSTLHLNLTLAGALSPEFTRLAAAASAAGTRLGVELQFMEVVADLALYAEVRSHLQAAGCAVVVDGVDHFALLFATPAALQADLLKFDWSPRIPALPAREQRILAGVIGSVGANSMLLNRAETEAALAWGRSQGIRRFQGRHVDAMLAADRITACPHSAACTLRQCIDRSAATDAIGQIGCRNTALLDGSTQRQPTRRSASA